MATVIPTGATSSLPLWSFWLASEIEVNFLSELAPVQPIVSLAWMT